MNKRYPAKILALVEIGADETSAFVRSGLVAKEEIVPSGVIV